MSLLMLPACAVQDEDPVDPGGTDIARVPTHLGRPRPPEAVVPDGASGWAMSTTEGVGIDARRSHAMSAKSDADESLLTTSKDTAIDFGRWEETR